MGWKPLVGAGSGVVEIRIRGRQEHRVVYVAKLDDAVYVLHAFEKKTRRIRKSDLDLVKSRLRQIQGLKRGREES